MHRLLIPVSRQLEMSKCSYFGPNGNQQVTVESSAMVQRNKVEPLDGKESEDCCIMSKRIEMNPRGEIE